MQRQVRSVSDRLKAGYHPCMTKRSWLPDANNPGTDFPLSHLPYGAFQAETGQHLCVAVGAHLLDLCACAEAGLLPEWLAPACKEPTLNALMSLGAKAWTELREVLTSLLADPSQKQKKVEVGLHSIAGATLVNPVKIAGYTDFYASIHHATRVGSLFRPDQPLLPNYKHVPIGYHGRSSSIIPSGMPVVRPHGQTRPDPGELQSKFMPTNALDYEIELAYYIGQPNSLGVPIPIAKAEQHLFGVGLLNDWSARDIQSWEYQPLGPFLGKNFATSVSLWVTPMEALEPFLVPMTPRPKGDPKPLKYLTQSGKAAARIADIQLEAAITTPTMRENKLAPFVLGRSTSRDLYWSPAQLVAHHTSNGCNLQVGDVLATGTISGPDDSSAGCLLEITRNGTNFVKLPTGEVRAFLADGDEIILRGYCEAPDHSRIGLGECRATIMSARRWPTEAQ